MAMTSISDLLYDVFNCADLDILNSGGGGSGSGCIDDILELAESSTLNELMDSPIFSTDASLFSFEDLFSHSKLPFLEQPDYHPAAAAKKELAPVGNTVFDGSDANNAAKKARRTLWSNPEPEVVKNQLSQVQAALPQNKKSKHGGDSEKEETKDNRMTHITVERNRRKQMNDNLAILRALMPTSYVQRGDQASIVGGVVEFVKELQQLLQSLEGQKQRKAYMESLSPQTISGMTTTASIRSSALAQTSTATTTTNTTLQIQLNTSSSTSPRSSQQSIGFCPQLQQRNVQQLESDGDSYRSGLADHELGATSKSAVAQVEVKISGSNVHLNTVSKRAPGQLLSIISTLEILSLQILHLNITTLDSGATILYNFTLKIGIDCKLCVDELAEAVQGILRESHAVKGSRCHPA